MIVRCENCQTEFALDDRQIPPGGVTVRCSVCAHVFTVDAPGGEDAQSWQIRTVDDLLFTAPDLATLKQWIDEGRLHPDDQVSRTGQAWLRLGDMPELAAAFGDAFGAPPLVTTVAPPPEPDSERSAVEELGPPPSFAGLRVPVDDEPPRSTTVPWAPAIDRGARAPAGGGASPPRPPPAPTPPAAASPLESVTQHAASAPKIKPLTRPPMASAPDASPPTDPPPAPVAGDPRPGPGRTREPSFDVQIDDDALAEDEGMGPERRARRGRVFWPVFALLGVAAGVAVVFGHPDVRAVVLGTGSASSASADAAVAEQLASARTALFHMSLNEVARTEATLQRSIDGGGSDEEIASMRLAQGELLVHRALLLRMAAVLDPARADGFRERASDDVQRAARNLDALGPGVAPERASALRARLRLAQERSEAEILALLPDDDLQGRWLVTGAPLWRTPGAEVPEGLVPGLLALEDRGGLAEALLILALLRQGDEAGARREATRVLVTADDHPVAKAVLSGAAAGALAVGEGTGGAEDGEGEGTTGAPGEATGDGEDDEDEDGRGKSGAKARGGEKSGGGGGGGGGGLTALIDRGCRQVESGSASAGVSTLLKAFDRDPDDLDVLVCLGQGYAKMSNFNRADHFLSRALKKSPNHRSALATAAGVAAKRGQTQRAVSLYEKVLAVSPSDKSARDYIQKHKGGARDDDPGEGGGSAPSEAPKPLPGAGEGSTQPTP